MSSSMLVQANIKGTFTCPSSLPSRKLYCKTQFSVKRRAPIRRALKISATATLEAVESPSDSPIPLGPALPQEAQKSEAVAKKFEKPRLRLKFIWMEKNIGLGLDHELSGRRTVPLSPYYFWPRKDAWEELKTALESKPWISQKEMIILLNQATDIINLWQQSGGNLSS